MLIYDPETGDFTDGRSMEEYDKLYKEHVEKSTDLSEVGKYELTDPAGFDSFGGAPENFYRGEELETYQSALQLLRQAVKEGSGDPKTVPTDLTDWVYSPGGEADCYYALWDFDEDGTKEMVVGILDYYEDSETPYIRPVGIYTIKDGKPYLFSELYYYKEIVERKWICTEQGGGAVDAEHENGYYFVIKDGAPVEVPENEVAGGVREFQWWKLGE